MTKNYFLFREQVMKIILNSNLNVGAVYYILKDILKEIEFQFIGQVNKELTEESVEINSSEDIEEHDKKQDE